MKILRQPKVITDAFVITKQFHSPTEFSQFIEKQSVSTNVPLMDVIIDYCQKNDIEIENVGKLITRSLKEKIRVEATANNMLKGKKAASSPPLL